MMAKLLWSSKSFSLVESCCRFEHSLGVMHLARSLCEALAASKEDTHLVEVLKPHFFPSFATKLSPLQIAGLCHDLGHGPYSHLWESFVR